MTPSKTVQQRSQPARAPSKKKKIPRFIRQDYHKKRLKGKWLRPKGIHSKVRHSFAGHQALVSVGYSQGRYHIPTNREGLAISSVTCLKDLERIDPSTGCAVISSTIGFLKKKEMLQKAKERGIAIDNFDPEEYLRRREEEFKAKKEKAKKRREEHKKAQPEKKTEPALEKVISEEEKKEMEKKEKDKLLTQRNTA